MNDSAVTGCVQYRRLCRTTVAVYVEDYAWGMKGLGKTARGRVPSVQLAHKLSGGDTIDKL